VLQRALYYHPDDTTLCELRVKVAAGRGEEEGALRDLVRQFPDEPRYAIDLAALLVGQGRQKEARKILEPLTQADSPTVQAQAHFHLARSYYRRDQPDKALGHLDKAEEADEDTVHTVRALVLRGNILEELGKPADAARAYLAALQLEREAELPLKCLTRLYLAHGTLAHGDRSQALEYLRRYTVAVGDDPAGLLQAADFALRLGRSDEALDLAGRAGDQAFQARAHRVLGLAHWKRGELQAAAEDLARAEKDAAVLEARIRICLLRGDLAPVRGLIEEADRMEKPPAELRQAADRARAVLTRRERLAKDLAAPKGKEQQWARVLDACACAEEARAAEESAACVEELVSRALEGGVEVGPALALRGRLSLDRGRLSAALADAERGIRLSPARPEGYFVRGRVRLERTAPGALDDLAKAAQLSGRTDAEILHALADALFQAGRKAEAVAAQKEAIKLKPRNREMVEQLGRFEKAGNGEGVRN
jgi:tetratricopeptide (TPR) repeat protein